ncbi:uncharacterized protein LOC126687332 isoform X2 [Mercurialis annua]|nr:uncharacterized protein LOC126687332 isoform X2 [Mercurialis annua]
MNHAMIVIHDELKNAGSDPQEGGVFVRGMSRFVTSDELRVCPPSTTASFPFFSKFGVEDASSVEEMTFKVGLPEVLNLLKNSLISKTPLTDTLLEKPKEIPELSDESLDQESSLDKLLCMTDSLLGFFFQTLNLMKSSLIPKKALKEVPEKKMPESGLNVFGEEISLKRDIGELASKITGKIPIRLMLCKSKRIVCYAEAGKDFVDLLFSFLALPLGYIAKEARGTPSKGCINHLYESVEDLDVEKYFKSHYHKEILLTPKIAPGFVYENQLLEVEEARAVDHYYYLGGYKIHAGIHSGSVDNAVTVESRSSSGGFVIKPALFTITDDLVVTPISTISCVSAMNKLEIPFSDIEERIVYMGKDEASRLMVASFTSEAALTETFIRKCTSEAAPTENSIVN